MDGTVHGCANPPEVETKRKQVSKWLERFIFECDKLKWKGQHFAIELGTLVNISPQ
jgi:hypothetical protein